MERRIIKQKESYTITLPKQWVENLGLRHKDVVNLFEDESQLTISTTGVKKVHRVMDVTKIQSDTAVRYILNNLYRSGVDKLELQCAKSQHQVAIQTLPTLIGWQITSSSENKIIIENLTEPSPDSFYPLLRRLFHIIRHNLKHVNDPSQIQFDESVSIDNFCRRAIFKKKIHIEKSHFYWQLVSTLVWIDRDVYYFVNDSHKKSKMSLSHITKIVSYFSQIETGFYKKDIFILSSVLDSLKTEIQSFDVKSKSDTYIFRMYRDLQLLCSPALVIIGERS